MRVGVFFSGGKDSTISAFLMESSGYEPVLITFMPEKKHSYMLQGEALELTKLQAEAMSMEHHTFTVSGQKEVEIEEMLKCVEGLSLEGIAAGALESEYQKQRVDYIANQLGVPSYSPIWKRMSVEELYREMEIIFVKVSSEGMGKELLGEKFRPNISTGHPLLEGGEAETAVLDAPFFTKRIVIKESSSIWHNTWGELLIKEAALENKP